MLDRTAVPRPVQRRSRTRRATVACLGLAATLALPATTASAATGAGANDYTQANLVADQPGMAQLTDPSLVNAWGLSSGPSTPLWVSDNGADATTLYTAGPDGTTPAAVPLVVSIPGGEPTGQVFNATNGFMLPDGASALFMFASEAGVITAWNPGLSPVTSAITVVSRPGAVYKGLALVPFPNAPRLLAANFATGKVDVFGTAFHPINLGPTAFTDPKLPRRYAPFNIAVVGDRVFVSYAKQDAAKHDDVAGPGHGFVDVFTPGGRLLDRFAQRGPLNSPWGMTIAPAGFGMFAGDLLVGNFGDGRIHAYNPWTGHLDGALRDGSGHAVAIDGLWGLLPGNGTNAPTSDVWFAAGPGGEAHGLLGLLSAG